MVRKWAPISQWWGWSLIYFVPESKTSNDPITVEGDRRSHGCPLTLKSSFKSSTATPPRVLTSSTAPRLMNMDYRGSRTKPVAVSRGRGKPKSTISMAVGAGPHQIGQQPLVALQLPPSEHLLVSKEPRRHRDCILLFYK